MAKVFIDGQAGTTGLKIADRLAGHAHVQLLEIDEALRKDVRARAAVMDEADVVFLCLPDEAAVEAARLARPGVIVIDASTAHRTQPGWTYGMPELNRDQRARVAASRRIANPGCYATGFILAVKPLIELGLMDADHLFSCVGLSGYSGAGKGVIAAYEAHDRPAAYDSPRQYALTLAHKHLPEMTLHAGLAAPPLFTPVICDFYCGMTVGVPVFTRHMVKKRTPRELREQLAEYYAGHRLIEVLPGPEDGFLPANLMAGRDGLKLFVTGNDEQIALTCAFDNLGKGASGAAIQNMNLALGLNEYESLEGMA